MRCADGPVDEVMSLLARGEAQRSVAATNMNEASSRSHSILACTVETRQRRPDGQTTTRRSRMHLVDLAGAAGV
jgi:hypothetical protein